MPRAVKWRVTSAPSGGGATAVAADRDSPSSASGRKQLEGFPLARWGSRRRRDLLELLDSVLDVARETGLRAVEKVRSARGPARNRRWCSTEHRVIDWAARSPSPGSSN